MNSHELLNLCIQRSPRRSGASAAEIIGVTRATFSSWHKQTESKHLPSPDYWPKIAKLSGESVQKVAFIILAEMTKTPEVARVYEGLAA